MRYELPPKKKISTSKKLKYTTIAIAIIAIFFVTFTQININWERIFSDRTINNFSRVIPQLFSPDWSTFGKVMEKMVETVFIAYAGALMASIIAVPMAFLAARNMFRFRIISSLGKWLLDAVRAFPELVFAIIFVATVGPGPFAGVLAIAINSTGMLGKLYSEVIESIDMKVVEAMEANGANKTQVFFYGILPQVIPEFLSYAIYRFEVDVRASSVLGIVGAGGIGFLITIAVANRNWDEVGMILLVIIIVVTIIDYISSFIRKRLV
ncbi:MULTISPECIES: phosphonate ABC transporter, permease protein PhnE [Sutcliffiella]|uniref:Phosphonate ABC transporter, permease protein PhnE n=1 Tax=Sutcliffiella cohnii TaxID=33932 RepID=A0A223KPN1_9BACI|nr:MULTISPECIES: phosphonate ABC transporter, permease protein PhnE [Sutcliffiella]AST91442.1 phosphonate ABC transporter, permease protein PhnE [Sutcliffiella cohnii]WBL17267.1 phosphonate ABC transporter, permease protein PhnE [Sutcliffiella sp. NC1]